MDSLRLKLPSEALAQGANPKTPSGKQTELRTSPQSSGRPGENQRAPLAFIVLLECLDGELAEYKCPLNLLQRTLLQFLVCAFEEGLHHKVSACI